MLIVPIFMVGCAQKDEKLSKYYIDATYEPESQTLVCEQSVLYTNNTGDALGEICFFLYANSFSEVASTKAYFNKTYPNGEDFGKIEFESIYVNGQPTNYAISDGKNILTLTLDNTLFPQECVKIDLKYTVFLANVRHRLGYYDDTANFGNFFPIVCVHENGGFVKNEYALNGDPFYSDVADFDVRISFPSEFVCASSGNKIETTENGVTVARCEAKKVRDFAFVLSKKFKVLTAYCGETEISYYYYNDENAENSLEIAKESLETFGELFGDYPYSTLSVVQTNFCFGGMEYPNLVMIADDITGNGYVIVHEIAHQWWYGVVGNNEFTSPWVDEGLTEFSTALFYEKHPEYGLSYDEIMKNADETYKKFVEVYTKINGQVDESMDRNLNEFATEPEYVNITYTKGMLMFDNIRRLLGDKKFFKCLKNYYKTFMFKNSSADLLIESFTKSAGMKIQKLFYSWIEGSVMY